MRAPTALPNAVKNVHGKTQPQQRKMMSKATKGEQPLLSTTMMQANPKFVIGQPMLIADELRKAGQLVSTFITTTSRITRWVKT
jgi:hypothetical protein